MSKFQEVIEREMRNITNQIAESIYNPPPIFGQGYTKAEQLACEWPPPWFISSSARGPRFRPEFARDFTTMLCEQREMVDDGLQRAQRAQDERLAQVLIDIADEWGVGYELASRFD